MKSILMICGLVLLLSPVYAQKDKSKKVKTNYLHIPIMDATQVDPSTMTFEFAFANIDFGKEAMKDVKTVCKNNSTGKAQEVTTYFYQVPITKPESYVIGKGADGKVVFAAKVSELEMVNENFGYQKCKNFQSENLKKTWASGGEKFKSNIQSKIVKALNEQAGIKAKEGVYPYFMSMSFDVYYAKGKDFDYSDLDKALEMALNAYENIEKNGLTEQNKTTLLQCIDIWEKEIETSDLENNKARINKKIARGLHENCARAYAFIHQFDQAIEHGRQFKILFGNYSNNQSVAMDQFMILMREQSIRAENNVLLIKNLAAMNQMAMEFKKQKIELNVLPNSEFATLKTAYTQFWMESKLALVKDMKEQEETLVAEGKVNPYAKFVNKTATGTSIFMNFPPSSLSGIPELSEFPKEICSMDDVNQVMIIKNKIASIPPEIVNMKSLTNLNLSSNALTSLPVELCQLTQLTKLNLSNNPITDFPVEIAQLKNLKKLNLKNTNLSEEKQAELQALLPNCKISF